jgi:CheY-like chemotaxis protein
MEGAAMRTASHAADHGRWTVPPARLAVLIVSGDETVRAAAARDLAALGYAVSCAAHSGHALLACLTGPRIDVAFIEATLEDMPGAELAGTLRRHLPDLRVVFLGHTGAAAAPGVVVRPFTGEDLAAELEVLTLTAS